MRSRRLVFFLLAIALGLGLALLYTWVLNPVRYTDTLPASLRADYKADTVLMVAEIYAADQDLPAAVRRLGFFANEKPLALVQRSIISAQQLGYTRQDVELLANLAQGLEPAP